MLFVWLSQEEAGAIVDALPASELRLKLQRVMVADILPDDGVPRTAILRNEGDGLHVVAVSYDNAEAADRAWGILWAKLQNEPAPVAVKPGRKQKRKVP